MEEDLQRLVEDFLTQKQILLVQVKKGILSMIGQNRQRQNIQGARPQSDWIFSEKSPDCVFCLGTIPKIRK